MPLVPTVTQGPVCPSLHLGSAPFHVSDNLTQYNKRNVQNPFLLAPASLLMAAMAPPPVYFKQGKVGNTAATQSCGFPQTDLRCICETWYEANLKGRSCKELLISTNGSENADEKGDLNVVFRNIILC